MLIACWSVKGGAGVSTIVAGVAVALAQERGAAVVADLAGDQALLHGLGDGGGAGLRGWTRAGPEVPDDALARIEEPIDDVTSLLPTGGGRWAEDRAEALAAALTVVDRSVVADVGLLSMAGPVGRAVIEAATSSVLVIRACPLSLRAVAEVPVAVDAIVVVRDPRRAVRWSDVADRCGAPVVAEVDVDPVVGASVDAGLATRPFPGRFVRALRGTW